MKTQALICTYLCMYCAHASIVNAYKLHMPIGATVHMHLPEYIEVMYMC